MSQSSSDMEVIRKAFWMSAMRATLCVQNLCKMSIICWSNLGLVDGQLLREGSSDLADNGMVWQVHFTNLCRSRMFHRLRYSSFNLVSDDGIILLKQWWVLMKLMKKASDTIDSFPSTWDVDPSVLTISELNGLFKLSKY